MFNKILGAFIIIGAALLIVWLYNINQLLQYEICSSQPVTELSQSCKEILNGKI
jgi:hypothetical protein